MKKMTVDMVERKLMEMIGQEFDAEEIICAFGDFEEDGETEVIVGRPHNNGYDAIAYINAYSATQFLFAVDDGIITDIWVA